jgi:hypothetical protein
VSFRNAQVFFFMIIIINERAYANRVPERYSLASESHLVVHEDQVGAANQAAGINRCTLPRGRQLRLRLQGLFAQMTCVLVVRWWLTFQLALRKIPGRMNW